MSDDQATLGTWPLKKSDFIVAEKYRYISNAVSFSVLFLSTKLFGKQLENMKRLTEKYDPVWGVTFTGWILMCLLIICKKKEGDDARDDADIVRVCRRNEKFIWKQFSGCWWISLPFLCHVNDFFLNSVIDMEICFFVEKWFLRRKYSIKHMAKETEAHKYFCVPEFPRSAENSLPNFQPTNKSGKDRLHAEFTTRRRLEIYIFLTLGFPRMCKLIRGDPGIASSVTVSSSVWGTSQTSGWI